MDSRNLFSRSQGLYPCILYLQYNSAVDDAMMRLYSYGNIQQCGYTIVSHH